LQNVKVPDIRYRRQVTGYERGKRGSIICIGHRILTDIRIQDTRFI
jgi:hypothetical protein